MGPRPIIPTMVPGQRHEEGERGGKKAGKFLPHPLAWTSAPEITASLVVSPRGPAPVHRCRCRLAPTEPGIITGAAGGLVESG